MRVVVVEDEKKARSIIIRLLQQIDANIRVVGEASTGEEGYELISHMYPDIVFTDIKMPGLNGIEMIRRLQNEGITSQYFIISGYDDFAYAQKGIDLGIKGYILKPISYDDIEIAIQKARKELKGYSFSGPIRERVKEIEIHRIIDDGDIESPIVRSAIQYVCDNISIPCSLNDTAQRLNISPDYLSRIFHKSMQMTFVQFVRMVKIDYTCVLLKKTNMKIGEISLAVGYRQTNYYCNIFKEVIGVSPMQYRRLTTKENDNGNQQSISGFDE